MKISFVLASETGAKAEGLGPWVDLTPGGVRRSEPAGSFPPGVMVCHYMERPSDWSPLAREHSLDDGKRRRKGVA